MSEGIGVGPAWDIMAAADQSGSVHLAPLRAERYPGVDPASLEAGARAIAGVKRGKSPRSTSVEAVWRSYVGQAYACLLAASGIEARSDATPKSGAAEGESPAREAGDAQ
jgi:hypothetical protein